MFFWRLPLPGAAALAVAIALMVVIPVAIHCRSIARSALARGIWDTVVVVEIIGSPGVFRMLMEPAIAEQARRGTYVDLSPISTWVPAFFAIVVLVAARLLFPLRGDDARALRWRAAFVASAIVFAILNLMNWCRGLCARYGFPFAYLTWSDAMTTIRGGSHPGAIVANIVVLAGIASILSILYRRRRT